MPDILILGSGGREHALGWLFASDPSVKKVWFAPGNGGTYLQSKGHNLPFEPNNRKSWPEIAKFIETHRPEWTIIGPEGPIALGLTDFLQSRGIRNIFAPNSSNALLESDKFFSHHLMEQLQIPRAEGIPCTDIHSARRAIRELFRDGIVLKARGLAQGKGVIVCDSLQTAEEALLSLTNKFGPQILVSQKLTGEEFSLFALIDGTNWVVIPTAVRDYKPAFDGDSGPNTGGMGSFAPHPVLSLEELLSFAEKVFSPIVQFFAEKRQPYRGFLYAGGIYTSEGPKILEFNVRMGDPETQALVPLLNSSLLDILGIISSGLKYQQIPVKSGASVCVVVAAEGYPLSPQSGIPLSDKIVQLSKQSVNARGGPFCKIFHAGTRYLHNSGRLVTTGGRVLAVTAYHPDSHREARKLAYNFLSNLELPSKLFFRTDIAKTVIPNNSTGEV